MEPRKELTDAERGAGPSPEDGPDEYFRKALIFARANYAEQVDHIAATKLEEVTPEKFFLEYVWVVHATGFNAGVVGRMMPRLEEAYGDWRDLGAEDRATVLERVRKVCNNPLKISAIHATARLLREKMLGSGVSWEDLRQSSFSSPELLQELPYIGKVTCHHLARNIGIQDSVKPDLHLVRLAKYWNFPDCVTMCKSMQDSHAQATGETVPLGIVDLVLWYASSTFGTISVRAQDQR